MPNVSYCEDNNEVHYNPLPVIIATDDTNLPLMNIARTYGWVKQDATEFYESEANAVANIIEGISNTFVNTHTQETINTPYGEFTLDLWYDKDENKWYDTTGLIGGGDFTLTNTSFKTIRPNKSQDGETATLYEDIDWTNIVQFDEFQYFTNITELIDNIFYGCTNLTSIIIPNSVTSIGDEAFYECTNLTSIIIPNSVTNIGENTFSGCSGLTSVSIPNSVTSIGDAIFSACSGLTSVSIPNSVTSIGQYAFSGCSGLTSVTIPNSVTSIGDYAFHDCTSLASIIIPNSVTTIGVNVFYGCTNLTSATIGNSVTSIGDYLFYGCTTLNSITSNAITAPTITSGTFSAVNPNGTLYVPQGSTGYDVWMQNANHYLGKYGWTKVEQ